jgi:hypothetical protein
MINFTLTEEDEQTITAIASRAFKTRDKDTPWRSFLDIRMDIAATHLIGNPLRLHDLLEADEFNFWHDVLGIARHLDRATGHLGDHFRPRFSQPMTAN